MLVFLLLLIGNGCVSRTVTRSPKLGEAVPKPDISQYLQDRARDAIREGVRDRIIRGLLN